jgi:hypothetical protein
MRKDRDHARKLLPFPIAAIKAEAIMTPTPGIVANRFASCFSSHFPLPAV